MDSECLEKGEMKTPEEDKSSIKQELDYIMTPGELDTLEFKKNFEDNERISIKEELQDIKADDEIEKMEIKEDFDDGLLNIKEEVDPFSTDDLTEPGNAIMQLVPTLQELHNNGQHILPHDPLPFVQPMDTAEGPNPPTHNEFGQADSKANTAKHASSLTEAPKQNTSELTLTLVKDVKNSSDSQNFRRELLDQPTTSTDDICKDKRCTLIKKSMDVMYQASLNLTKQVCPLQHPIPVNEELEADGMNPELFTVRESARDCSSKSVESVAAEPITTSLLQLLLSGGNKDTFKQMKNNYDLKVYGNSDCINTRSKPTHNKTVTCRSQTQVDDDNHFVDVDFNYSHVRSDVLNGGHKVQTVKTVSSDRNKVVKSSKNKVVKSSRNKVVKSSKNKDVKSSRNKVVKSSSIQSGNKSLRKPKVNLVWKGEQKFFCCTLCNKPFDRMCKLLLHTNSKCGSLKLFNCDICIRGFTTKYSLNSHINKVHHRVVNNSIFKCEHCDGSFKSKTNLAKHKKRKHEEKEYHACEYCQKSFSSRESLFLHRKMKHVVSEYFECAHCSKRFALKKLLAYHMRCTHLPNEIQKMHSEKRKVMCDVCGKYLSNKNHVLTNHLRTHTGEKPFMCPTCGKCFKAESNLTQHCVTHSEKRPFGCDRCDKAFRIRNHLRQHMAVHGFKNTSMKSRNQRK